MINRMLSVILLNSLILYIIVKFIPQLGMTISSYDFGIFFWVWLIFWIINDIVRFILKLLAFPFNILTLGLVWIFINIGILYLFTYVVNIMNIWVKVSLWTFGQVFLLSIVIAILNLFVKKI